MVDEEVGAGVLGAGNVGESVAGTKVGKELVNVVDEGLEVGLFDFVVTQDLVNDEVGVEKKLQVGVRIEREVCRYPNEGGDDGLVFGGVVGGVADDLTVLVEDLAGGGADDKTNGGWSGVAAGAAVGVDGEGISGGVCVHKID